MIARWVTVVLCFLMVVGLSTSLGCSAERNRYRRNSVSRDLDHLVAEVDWLFGVDEESMLYEDSFPPHP
jgi:hypothetical protein